MNNQTYRIDINPNLVAYGSVPVVKREVKQQPAYAPEAYDDYGVGGVYLYPSFNLSILLIFAGIIFAAVQLLLGIGAILLAFRRKSRKCPNCGGENMAQDGKLPDVCRFCGTKL